MEHYITLFDSLYLPQGLALHESLEHHAGTYTLWVLCMDKETRTVLDQLNLPNLRTISLSDVETPELLAVKPNRTIGEYCWTITPFAPEFIFDQNKSIERVTYIDADLYFLDSVTPIFQEFEASKKAVLITEHAYAPDCDSTAESGRFCVQFITFQRYASEPVRVWWQDRCLEWCFARQEDGKFGDQKYLDEWPNIFADLVHVLQHPEWTLAPWNASRFPYSNAKFYHFHALRIIDSQCVDLCTVPYEFSEPVLWHVYQPYLKTLSSSIQTLANIGFVAKSQGKKEQLPLWLKIKIHLAKKLMHILEYRPQNIAYF
jgi:hypothetical protein